jgi:hypothetical protein
LLHISFPHLQVLQKNSNIAITFILCHQPFSYLEQRRLSPRWEIVINQPQSSKLIGETGHCNLSSNRKRSDPQSYISGSCRPSARICILHQEERIWKSWNFVPQHSCFSGSNFWYRSSWRNQRWYGLKILWRSKTADVMKLSTTA